MLLAEPLQVLVHRILSPSGCQEALMPPFTRPPGNVREVAVFGARVSRLIVSRDDGQNTDANVAASALKKGIHLFFG